MVKRPQLAQHSIRSLKTLIFLVVFLSSIYVTRAPYKGVGGQAEKTKKPSSCRLAGFCQDGKDQNEIK